MFKNSNGFTLNNFFLVNRNIIVGLWNSIKQKQPKKTILIIDKMCHEHTKGVSSMHWRPFYIRVLGSGSSTNWKGMICLQAGDCLICYNCIWFEHVQSSHTSRKSVRNLRKLDLSGNLENISKIEWLYFSELYTNIYVDIQREMLMNRSK